MDLVSFPLLLELKAHSRNGATFFCFSPSLESDLPVETSASCVSKNKGRTQKQNGDLHLY
jgi:hypothetical protein